MGADVVGRGRAPQVEPSSRYAFGGGYGSPVDSFVFWATNEDTPFHASSTLPQSPPWAAFKFGGRPNEAPIPRLLDARRVPLELAEPGLGVQRPTTTLGFQRSRSPWNGAADFARLKNFS